MKEEVAAFLFVCLLVRFFWYEYWCQERRMIKQRGRARNDEY